MERRPLHLPSRQATHPPPRPKLLIALHLHEPSSSGCALHDIERFTLAIPVSATIEDVYENLAQDVERGGRVVHVEIRVYFGNGGWESLVRFRDVVELGEERGVEGLVVGGYGGSW